MRDPRARGIVVGLSQLRRLAIVVVMAWAGPVAATLPVTPPQDDGPLTTRTIEFADLSDPARGGRRVPIKVHVPQWTGPFPLVVVSHGAGGNWDANYAQARHLASHGYVVLALEHVSSNSERLRQGMRFGANLKAMTRDASEVLGRPRDVTFALDQAQQWNQSHAQLKGVFDMTRVAAMGHSFGAYTVLAVCGARPALDWLEPPVDPGKGLGPDLSDARVKACVALSPQGPGEPFFLEGSFATLNRPVLAISGSRDEQQATTPANRRRFFELEPVGAKVFVWLANADHQAFSDATGSRRTNPPSRSRADVQPIARAATLLFLEAQLRGDADADARLSERGLQPLVRGVVNRIEVLRK
jgi:predicted dienelactone hydrolase